MGNDRGNLPTRTGLTKYFRSVKRNLWLASTASPKQNESLMSSSGKFRLIAALVFVITVIGILFQAGRFGWYALTPASSELTSEDGPTKVIVTVDRGTTGYALARKLRDEGIITDIQRFIWLGRIVGDWKDMKAGEYEVSGAMSPLKIFRVVTSGVSLQYPITVREGMNIYEIAASLESQGLAKRGEFLRLVKSQNFMKTLGLTEPLPPSLEGYLFPDTYGFPSKTTTSEIVKRMFDHFEAVWTKEFTEKAAESDMTRHQILTLASIIEKETGAPHERKIISSVFHNRLKKRMRLQSDPTTIYGMWEQYNGNIKKEHLTTPSPYNTYTLSGLPAGPIGNPGKEAIEAALYPEESGYFYFVSQNDGTHVFSSTYKEHQQAVTEFQLNRKARQGKSWRDLHKNTQNP